MKIIKGYFECWDCEKELGYQEKEVHDDWKSPQDIRTKVYYVICKDCAENDDY